MCFFFCSFKDISHCLTLDMKKVFSIIEYACIVWGIGNKPNSNRIKKLQKRTAQIVLRQTFKTSSQLMFNELKWLSFPTICIYFIILYYSEVYSQEKYCK